MRILLIGGTGTISTEITEQLVKRGEDEIYVLNRGNRNAILPESVHQIAADAYDYGSMSKALSGLDFDVAAHFVGFNVSQIKVACDVLKGHVGQFVYISSASAYQKPPKSYIITEDTPLENPFWEYSRNKQACEEYLFTLHKTENFPVTIVRPSHTYSERKVPVGMTGEKGSWQVLKRMIDGKPVIVHGDGSSLWAMTDSRDFAKGFIGLLGNSQAIGQAFHITTDQSISWDNIYLDIAEALSECLGRKITPVLCHVSSDMIAREAVKFGYNDMRGNLTGDKSNSVVFDNSKIKKVVPDFKCTISHKEGTLRTVRYILSHPEYQVEDPHFDRFCDHLASL